MNVAAALGEYAPDAAAGELVFGSAALAYRWDSPGHVIAATRVLNSAKSLIFTFPFNPVMKKQAGPETVQALWWRPAKSAGGFVALANAAASPASAQLGITGSAGAQAPERKFALPPHTTLRFPLRSLIALLPVRQRGMGGLTLTYQGPMGAVILSGGDADRRSGFSAEMPAAFGGGGVPQAVTYLSPGLMLGPPPLEMGFPIGLRFTPFLLLRNTTAQPLPVSVQLNWMRSGAPASIQAATQTLPPLATEQMELGPALDQIRADSGAGAMVNLSFSFQGRSGDLIPMAGTMDQTENYVFLDPPHGASPTPGREAVDWRLEDGFDTMISIWNWGPKEQDLTATFYYGDGSGAYTLPVTLPPGDSQTIDLMQLASAGTPDPAGQPFSMSPGFGSMALDLAGGKQGWITAAVNIGVYNPKTATCGTICVDCCGYTYATMDPTAADVAPGAQTSFIVNAEDCNGNTHNISAAYQPLWGTDNANVATPADNGHPAATGFYTGVASGQTTVYAQFDDMPVNAGEVCYEGSFTCPVTTGGAQATVTVDSISAALATPPVPNDANGVIAHQSFTLNIVIGGGMSAPDTGYSGTANLTYSPALGTGESGPASVSISGGKGSAAITLITASGTQTAPSSSRSITISAANFSPTTASLHLYWEVAMDQEDWKNPGFQSCQTTGMGSYYCQTACTSGFAQPTEFIAIPGGLCGKASLDVEAKDGTGWSQLKEAPIEDCGPHTCNNPYWFNGGSNSPYPGGCLSDKLMQDLGAVPNPTVLWRFAQ